MKKTEGGEAVDRKKVVIIGTSSTTRGQAGRFFGDPEFEVWGLNGLYIVFPEVLEYATGWFQIHQDDDALSSDYKAFAMLDRYDFPVYMVKKRDEYKNSVAYPRDEVVAEFGTYFNNTISWILAFAMYKGFEEIHLYGVDMAVDVEYGHQRPSCEYFLGIATGRGIKMILPRGSDLLRAGRLYGFEDCNQIKHKIENDLRYCNADSLRFTKDIMKLRDERMKLIGALDGRIDDEEKRKWAEARVTELLGEEQKSRDSMQYMRGKMDTLVHFNKSWGFNI